MKEILYNLGLIEATRFCKDNNIDCSGSYLVKRGRGYVYDLVRTMDGTLIVSVKFHKSQVPTYQYNPDLMERRAI